MPEPHPTQGDAEPIRFAVTERITVSGLLQAPADERACLVLAHGAGAGMTHPSLASIAKELAERGIATLRYQFPYMEQGGKRPDPPKLAHATVRAAVAEAARLLPKLPLFAGGRSFGGRMTSQAQAISALPDVRGLVFFAFPLHPAGRPSHERGDHLAEVNIPMLFLQGTRDALAVLEELEPVCKALGERATLRLFGEADHSFHVPARTGRKDADVRAEMLDIVSAWIDGIAAQPL
jgi:predicted alpha/beta-hydrolase family hydrolase